MLYVQLDTNWPDNHKIIEAGVEGAGAHAILLCLAKRLESDGWVTQPLLRRYGISEGLVARLRDIRLVEEVDGRVRPYDWHSRNDSQAAIEAKRAIKKESGALGNHKRWHPGVRFEDCEKCQVIAGSDRTGSQEKSTAIASDPTPTSRAKAEVTTAIASCDDISSVRAQNPFLQKASDRT